MCQSHLVNNLHPLSFPTIDCCLEKSLCVSKQGRGFTLVHRQWFIMVGKVWRMPSFLKESEGKPSFPQKWLRVFKIFRNFKNNSSGSRNKPPCLNEFLESPLIINERTCLTSQDISYIIFAVVWKHISCPFVLSVIALYAGDKTHGHGLIYAMHWSSFKMTFKGT